LPLLTAGDSDGADGEGVVPAGNGSGEMGSRTLTRQSSQDF
jgi:hypothetical protein